MNNFLNKNKKKLVVFGAVGLFVAGYIIGFNRVYSVQVSPTYRDPSLLRYLTGRQLDISAYGVKGGMDFIVDALKGERRKDEKSD